MKKNILLSIALILCLVACKKKDDAPIPKKNIVFDFDVKHIGGNANFYSKLRPEINDKFNPDTDVIEVYLRKTDNSNGVEVNLVPLPAMVDSVLHQFNIVASRLPSGYSQFSIDFNISKNGYYPWPGRDTTISYRGIIIKGE